MGRERGGSGRVGVGRERGRSEGVGVGRERGGGEREGGGGGGGGGERGQVRGRENQISLHSQNIKPSLLSSVSQLNPPTNSLLNHTRRGREEREDTYVTGVRT